MRSKMHEAEVEAAALAWLDEAGWSLAFGPGIAPDMPGAQARVIDFEMPANNDWFAVHQFAVIENKHSRCPDVGATYHGWHEQRHLDAEGSPRT